MDAPLRLAPSTAIVFDTNVLLSAFIFRKFAGDVYQYCAERYLLYSSEWMLAELSEKLESKKFRLPLTLQETILVQVREDVQLVYPTNEMPNYSRDPDDNNVLRLALFIKANFIITGDRDLLDLGQVEKTEIISPKLFFERYMM
ncbi:putative toxin-antitoxin system toxin component, PIN family [Spirosoma terrae]|uniref:Putative toxin-antitoxin system toxin component, PIN family n=1 Tax=Spirosoma terrae TaxID=1968276 RepID=A0A6L9L068_9BACT|nr:putative toxin-antitoxin system toxin component, PIN family [Spirosoma terrae]NDU93876.1 putative toxin-antitoxin system toxin component, PIN family [Spirosoma terrae]